MPPISPQDGPVAVTGASGYLGMHVARNLSEAGYAVHACVRDAADEKKTGPLRAMANVECFSCDLLSPGAYDAAFAGASAVFHVAAVLGNSGVGATEQMTYAGGVVATANVLASLQASGTVKRIVYTSSVSAVRCPSYQLSCPAHRTLSPQITPSQSEESEQAQVGTTDSAAGLARQEVGRRGLHGGGLAE